LGSWVLIFKNSVKNSKQCFGVEGLNFYSLVCLFDVVIDLGMGSAHDKPLTKKEREEKRRKRKEKRLKK